MSEDLEALLRKHYRNAAEGIVPGADLVERGQRAGRPARARTWPRVLAAAAAIAVVAAVSWALFRPVHRDQTPVTPPAPVSVAPSPTATRPARRPAPRPTATRPVPRRSRATTPVRSPGRRPVPTPTSGRGSSRGPAAP